MRHEGKLVGITYAGHWENGQFIPDKNVDWVQLRRICDERPTVTIESKERAAPTILRKTCEGLWHVLFAVILSVLFCSLGLLSGEYEMISPADFTVMVCMVCGFFVLYYFTCVFAEFAEDKSRPWKFYIIGYLLGILAGAIFFVAFRETLSQFTIDGTFMFMTHILGFRVALGVISQFFPLGIK